MKAGAGLYARRGKRAFDVLFSLAGIALCLPFFALCAAAIKLDSPGPVFFRQERMGRGGKLFSIFKFRTMRADPGREGLLFEPGDAARVTRTGRLLRALKLDELPQLFNVLAGQMSFVGPRPEVAKYREFFTGRYAAVLRVAPGITDRASLRYRDEEALLARAREPERFYREVVLPDKLEENLSYVEKGLGLAGDVAIILRTLARIFT